ncbi:hypothetical protein KY284_020884 [Solanum tuberosum]|nr:hypothetical protein KY284_020884 [Solanum tuberosum]
MGEYRPVQFDLKIPFLRITAIQNLEDDTVRIPIMGRSIYQSKNNIVGGLRRRILFLLISLESGPYIVIVTETTVKEFRGEITFASTTASKTHVNLPMDNINSLIQKFAPKPINIQTI